MEIKTNPIVVEKYNFEANLGGKINGENKITVQLNEVEPAGDDKSILDEGKMFKVDVPFELSLERFNINGHISRIVQLVDYFGEADELDKSFIAELSSPLIDYIKRLTYEVTEIAFDEPGFDLNFEAN
ncbi:hypothetical protein X560_1641 [Listeria fleischmannii 1991]|uniref:Uncharacterized protein conserved in bacteria n=2 Tax=Listeria fleischmannii TaxID=1069827 RepID=A0A2X3HM91_9LIST|nr:DUF1149 family protein [Listeria fleischmannii]EMG29368.1 hypothetical protein LFLEISCH_00360 [Listeria fleischmannii subsp. fleischmannii LU2006-1]KMT59313.1 hypothetical protein X560_1641 [Listeria fleischmannii 1991]SQC72264.1 Uncharacterized protein conserved in bacteria [Listeria fleischmannii subsp. fleischmannii]